LLATASAHRSHVCSPVRPSLLGMIALAVVIVASPLVVGFYAYVIYPAVLWIITRFRNTVRHSNSTWNWPSVTVTVPVYNAASTIRRTLEQILALDYPLDRLQILVLSDASTDGTDDVAREFSGRGVELLRAPERRGKTAVFSTPTKTRLDSAVLHGRVGTRSFGTSPKRLPDPAVQG